MTKTPGWFRSLRWFRSLLRHGRQAAGDREVQHGQRHGARPEGKLAHAVSEQPGRRVLPERSLPAAVDGPPRAGRRYLTPGSLFCSVMAGLVSGRRLIQVIRRPVAGNLVWSRYRAGRCSGACGPGGAGRGDAPGMTFW